MRKYKGSYKIPIKKHTKVRRPVSRHLTALGNFKYNYNLYQHPILTRDIKPVREVSVAGYAEKLISLFNERGVWRRRGFISFVYIRKRLR